MKMKVRKKAQLLGFLNYEPRIQTDNREKLPLSLSHKPTILAKD